MNTDKKILVKVKPELLKQFVALPVKRDMLISLYIVQDDFIQYIKPVESYKELPYTSFKLSLAAIAIIDDLVTAYGTTRNDVLEQIIIDILFQLDDVPLTKLIK